jgi:hypothetical protein
MPLIFIMGSNGIEFQESCKWASLSLRLSIWFQFRYGHYYYSRRKPDKINYKDVLDVYRTFKA